VLFDLIDVGGRGFELSRADDFVTLVNHGIAADLVFLRTFGAELDVVPQLDGVLITVEDFLNGSCEGTAETFRIPGGLPEGGMHFLQQLEEACGILDFVGLMERFDDLQEEIPADRKLLEFVEAHNL